MADLNPYAPPIADDGAAHPAPRRRRREGNRTIEDALAALEDHLSRPESVALDRKAVGGRFRGVTFLLLAAGGVALALRLLMPASERGVIGAIVIGFGFLFLVIGIIAALIDLSLERRDVAGSPLRAFRSHVKSLQLGRYGYAWATLSPTARAGGVNAPDLGPVAAGGGSFSLENEAGLKAYAMTFARPGGGRTRAMQIKGARVVRDEGDVAVVQATMLFLSWPLWANVLAGVGTVFVVRVGERRMGPLAFLGAMVAVVGLIGLFVLRKKHQVVVQRTLLRGRNGAWYFLDADILEEGRSDDE